MSIKLLILPVLAGLCTAEIVYAAAALEQLEKSLTLLSQHRVSIPRLDTTKILLQIQAAINDLESTTAQAFIEDNKFMVRTENVFRKHYLGFAFLGNVLGYDDPTKFEEEIKISFTDNQCIKKFLELDQLLKRKWAEIEALILIPEL